MSDLTPDPMQPEKALALANAIALRMGLSESIGQRILAGMQGLDYEAPTVTQMQGAHLGRTVLFLSKIEVPGSTLSWEELTDAAHSNGGYAKDAEELSAAMGATVDAEDVRAVLHALTGELKDESDMNDEQVTQHFARTLDSARQVAVEHETDVASVYETDELYYEACRKAFTAAEMADTFCHKIEGISSDVINNVFVRQIENIIPKSVLQTLNPQDLSEMVAAIQLDPKAQAFISERVELSKEAMRQMATYLILRIYGIDTLEELSMDQRIILIPRTRLVAEVFDDLARK